MSEPRVAAVVVTYDALPWIEHCLDSLRGVETVVVDNGSSDGTVGFVRERFPEVVCERPVKACEQHLETLRREPSRLLGCDERLA